MVFEKGGRVSLQIFEKMGKALFLTFEEREPKPCLDFERGAESCFHYQKWGANTFFLLGFWETDPFYYLTGGRNHFFS